MDLQTVLEQREQELEKKIEDYNNFLIEKWDSADRSKVLSDKNAASVELKTVRYSLGNLKEGKPVLGYEIKEVAPSIQNTENKKNKQL